MTMLPKPRAVIFDWDDTVVNNWHTSLAALNAALKHMGHKEWSDEDARRNAMYSARDLFTNLFGDKWEEADKVFYDSYYSMILNNVVIYDGIEDIFRIFFQKKIPMFVVSNKRGKLLRHEVEGIGFAHYFEKIIGAGDADKDKPDPAPVFLALEGTGIPAAPDVWFIGDSQTDIICANAAGCSSVLIETKLPPEELLIKNPPALRLKDHIKIMEYIKPYFT